jgi:hypothetical protein
VFDIGTGHRYFVGGDELRDVDQIVAIDCDPRALVCARTDRLRPDPPRSLAMQADLFPWKVGVGHCFW